MDSLTSAGGAIQLDNVGINKLVILNDTDIGWIYPNFGGFGSAKSESINWSDRSSFPTGCDNDDKDVYPKPIAKSVNSSFIISSGTQFSWMFGSWNNNYSGDLSGVSVDISSNIQIVLVKIPCTSISSANSSSFWQWTKFNLDINDGRCGSKTLAELNAVFVKDVPPKQGYAVGGSNISALLFSPGDGLGMYIFRNGLCINKGSNNEFISPATFSIKVASA
jgi:hypothetical protein